MVQSGNVEWSVMEINEADAERAVKLNLLEPLDPTVVNLAGHPKELQDAKFVGNPAGSTRRVLGYRSMCLHLVRGRKTGRVLGRERRSRPRALRNSPVDNLEFALMADGVPANKLYPLDVDRRLQEDAGDKAEHFCMVDDRRAVGTGADRQGMRAWNGLARPLFTAIKDGAPIAIDFNQE